MATRVKLCRGADLKILRTTDSHTSLRIQLIAASIVVPQAVVLEHGDNYHTEPYEGG